MSVLKTLHVLPRMCASCVHITRGHPFLSKFGCDKFGFLQFKMIGQCRLLSDSICPDPSLNTADYPTDVEVSHEDFKFVELLLPQSTVPDIPDHLSSPTPSGWNPPNEQKRTQQSYLVRRTKNHMLPVYPGQKPFRDTMLHHVTVRNIEGDIWKLESELCHFLQNITGQDKVITQVHEVSRCIRVRGQHRASIAEFLLDKGM